MNDEDQSLQQEGRYVFGTAVRRHKALYGHYPVWTEDSYCAICDDLTHHGVVRAVDDLWVRRHPCSAARGQRRASSPPARVSGVS